MALHLVVGFKTPGPSGEPESLYCGRDADQARAAVAAYRGAATKWIRNPKGITKFNEAIAADKDRERMAASIAAAPPLQLSPADEKAREIARLQSENDRLRKALESAPEPEAASGIETPDDPQLELSPDSDPAPEVEADADPEPAKKVAGPRRGPSGKK